MVLSLNAATKAAFEAGGSEPVWLAEMYLGALAHLTVLDYTDSTLRTVTLEVTTTGGTTISTPISLVPSSQGSSNAEVAAYIAAVINTDSGLSDRVFAFVHGDICLVHGYADKTFRAQNTDYVAEVYWDVDSADTAVWGVEFEPVRRIYYFISGSTPNISLVTTTLKLIPEIRDITNVAAEIDPMTREFSIGDIEIVFDDQNQDSVIRDLLSRTLPFGRLVKLWIGTTTLTAAQFAPAGQYIVKEVLPARGTITVTCSDIHSIIDDKKFDNRASPRHVVQLGEDTLGSGVTLDIDIFTPSGDFTASYTEGVDWTGSNGFDAVAFDNLATAINANGVTDDYIFASQISNVPGTNISQLGIFLITDYGATAPDFEDRPVRFRLRSDNPAKLTIAELDSFQNGKAYAPSCAGWVNIHPIHALRDLYVSLGVKVANIDEDSFDLDNYPTISHWGISAHDQISPEHLDIYEDAETNDIRDILSFEIRDRLCKFVQGSVVSSETGKIKFVRRDLNAAAVKSLTVDDYDELVWEELYTSTTNKISIYGTAFGTDNSYKVTLLLAENTTAQKLQSTVAENSSTEMIIEDSFLGVFSLQSGLAFLNGSSTSFGINRAWNNGFSGCRQDRSLPASGLPPTGHDLTGTRVAYFMLWNSNKSVAEYVSATAAVFAAASDHSHWTLPPSETAYATFDPTTQIIAASRAPIVVYEDWVATISRGALGSVITDFSAVSDLFDQMYAVDVTIPKAMADHFLSFSFGTPIVSFRTTLKHYDLQLGDVIALTDASALLFLANGVDENTTWEIVSKELEFPFVRFKAARLVGAQTPADYTVFYEPSTEITSTPSTEAVTDNSLILVTTDAFEVVFRG